MNFYNKYTKPETPKSQLTSETSGITKNNSNNDAPVTGDESSMIIFFVILVAASICIVLISLKRKSMKR